MPHRPNTTDGTTATRSVSDTSHFFSHDGATCVVNKAMPMLTGTEMTTAMRAVTAVP